MEMDRFAQQIRERLDREDKYRPNLFCRGYLITDAKVDNTQDYPFYGLWQRVAFGEYVVLAHPDTTVFTCEKNRRQVLLIGHAYNPKTGEIREDKILEQVLDADTRGEEERNTAVDALTGIFVIIIRNGRQLWAVQDCGGQKMLYFGNVGEHVVLTSIPQLAGDVFDLQWDKDVERLRKTKGYHRGSGFLPGNLSPYKELTRLGANTALTLDDSGFYLSRIYPRKARAEFSSMEEKTEAIEEIYRLFSRNIELATQKWPRAGLSLTGGVDSRATFACANGHYRDIYVFSFQSKPSEKLDADAARMICETIGVKHNLYEIPEDPEEIPDYEFLHAIIDHNTSHLCKLHPT